MKPPVALLLDLDGPLANPEARTVIEPTILPSIKALLLADVPVVINTGRSAEFVLEHVVRPMKPLGGLPATGFYAVGEQGAVWFPIVEGEEQPLRSDPAITVPEDFAAAVMVMAEAEFGETMFVDHTKLAMVSVEQRLDVPAERYAPEQRRFVAEVERIGHEMGVPVIVDRPRPDDPIGIIRVHPTIISTDVEPSAVGKDLGASRAWAMLEADGLLPEEWRTVGDSPSDILMADWLYAEGQTVKHIDVDPLRRAPDDRPYDVLRPATKLLDDAGAAYLRWVLSGERTDEPSFENY